MKTSFKRLAALTALGLSLGMAAHAHPMAEGMDAGARFEQHRAQMLKFHEKRLSALKAKLQLSSGQDAAWASFQKAHEPPIQPMMAPLDRDALAKLSTPERLAQMQRQFEAHQSAAQTHMTQRAEATRQFYAQLTPEQQKVFDAETLPPAHAARMGHDGGHGHGAVTQP